jgi:hypothetical protein
MFWEKSHSMGALSRKGRECPETPTTLKMIYGAAATRIDAILHGDIKGKALPMDSLV